MGRKFSRCRNPPGQASSYRHFSHLAKEGSFSAVESAHYGLSWAQKVAGLPVPTAHTLPTLAKEGIRRRLGRPIRKKKLPLSCEILSKLARKAATSGTLFDLRLAAMGCLAFGGFLRYSDLSSPRVCDLPFGPDHVDVIIRKSKTDVYSKSQKVLVAASGKLSCPVTSRRMYFDKAGLKTIESEDFVFKAIRGTGSRAKLAPENKPLSYTKAREILKAALKELGYDETQYGLHSLRIGGASSAARSGVDHSLLAVHGRWRTEHAKDLYVRYSDSERRKVLLLTGVRVPTSAPTFWVSRTCH